MFFFFGLGFQYFAAGPLTETDPSGAELDTLQPYDMAFYWSYARLIAGFSVGASVKLIDSRIVTSDSAGAIDLGVLSPSFWDGRLRLAFTATNLGRDMLQFDQSYEPLPMALRLGSSCQITKAWLASLDAAFPRGDRPYGALGTEYWFNADGIWKFAGRMGFNSQTIGSIDGFTGLAFGFGIASRSFSVDYGLVPFGGLGQSHRMSVTFNF